MRFSILMMLHSAIRNSHLTVRVDIVGSVLQSWFKTLVCRGWSSPYLINLFLSTEVMEIVNADYQSKPLACIYMDLRNSSCLILTSGHHWERDGSGRKLSHWIIESAVYLQPIKRLIISTELFSVLTQSGWSFALCIAWCSQQWWLIWMCNAFWTAFLFL